MPGLRINGDIYASGDIVANAGETSDDIAIATESMINEIIERLDRLIAYQKQLHNTDTDADGLTDGVEVITRGTDPLRADTDADGHTDGAEVAEGFDPLHPESPALMRNRGGLDAAVAMWFDNQDEFRDTYKCEIGGLDVSLITDFSKLFEGKNNFNDDISGWDVSSAKTMVQMFKGCESFDQDLSGWGEKVSNVTDMNSMFDGCHEFNQDIGNWNVSRVTSMRHMFAGCYHFNQDIGDWNVQSVNFSNGGAATMFKHCFRFNQSIAAWIHHIDELKGVERRYAVQTLYCNSNSWRLFEDNPCTPKNVPQLWELINDWVRIRHQYPETAAAKFYTEVIGQKYGINDGIQELHIGDLNVGGIMNFGFAFHRNRAGYPGQIPFNDDISGWDVSNGYIFEYMFENQPKFNQDLSGWDVSNGLYFNRMFNRCPALINQDLSNWNLRSLLSSADAREMFLYTGQGSAPMGDLSTWKLPDSGVVELNYNANPGYQPLGRHNKRWIIQNRARLRDAVTFLLQNGEEGFKSYYEKEFHLLDVSRVKDFSQVFIGIDFQARAKPIVLDLANWDVSNATNMRYMFAHSSFNQDLSGWGEKVSNVTDMSYMFSDSQFNQDIGNWDVSNVEFMEGMFAESQFNQDLSGWGEKVSNVVSMKRMFAGSQFNQDIGDWDVSRVTNMKEMFKGSNFTQDISGWDLVSVQDSP